MKKEQVFLIIKNLQEELTPFKAISKFSDKPGIYAVVFIGDIFPLESARNSVQFEQIIYIGKTEDSQLVRDFNTHFKNGKSGSSTLRRTIGAILLNRLALRPVPRSYTEKNERRFTNYRFDAESEEKITHWMNVNLALAYWEYSGNVSELKGIEDKIIDTLKPILNLKKNRANPWYREIRSLRGRCVKLAKESATVSRTPLGMNKN
jgi:hypothetical protein